MAEESVIVLSKGGRLDLQKADPSLEIIRVAICWGQNTTNTGEDFDLDITAFSLVHKDVNGTKEAKISNNDDILFYNSVSRTEDGTTVIKDNGPYPKRGKPCSPDLAIRHSGDNINGNGDGEDEAILVDVKKIMAVRDEVSFVATINEAIERKQNFGQVRGAKAMVYNHKTNRKLAEYDLEETFSNETAVQIGSLYKNPEGNIGFKAVGMGYNLGLGEFMKGYGATKVS